MKKQIIIIISILVSAFALYSADVVVYPRTTGTPYPCPIPKTGQTNSYAAEDDGALQKGIAWPVTRFTVQANTNCVLDNLTGLMWARNSSNAAAAAAWGTAVTNCNNLNYGGYTDWRLPNVRELFSLIDFAILVPSLPVGHPFSLVGARWYWTSTGAAWATTAAWSMYINGDVTADDKAVVLYVWPVRGGY